MSEEIKKEAAEATQAGPSEKSTRRGRVIWRLVVVLCLLLIAGSVAMRLMKPEEAIETSPLSTVSVGSPTRSDIEIETSLVGTIMPDNVYYVMPKVAGEIKEIYVSQGDHVNEGDPICLIDNDAQVDSAKITLDSAKVQVDTAALAEETARTNYERMNALFATGDISAQSFESAKTGYEQAKDQLSAAQLQVEAAQLNYDLQVEFSTVTAPVSGVVESTNMSVNAMAAQSSQVCIISALGSHKVQFSVTDRLLSGIAVGDPIRIEKQGSQYEGAITMVEQMPDQATGLYSVEASIDDDNELTTGAGVKVYFVSESSMDALTIPTDAVYYDGGLTYAYILSYDGESASGALEEGVLISEENSLGTVHKAEIETGLSDGENTEVLSGISEDDVIITSWTAQLYEGARVQVLPDEEAES